MAEKMPNFALQNLWFIHSYISWYKEGGGEGHQNAHIESHGGGGGPEGVKCGTHDIWTAPNVKWKVKI